MKPPITSRVIDVNRYFSQVRVKSADDVPLTGFPKSEDRYYWIINLYGRKGEVYEGTYGYLDTEPNLSVLTRRQQELYDKKFGQGKVRVRLDDRVNNLTCATGPEDPGRQPYPSSRLKVAGKFISKI